MVKAGTKQVIRAEKWVAEYRRWVGSGLTQRSYCGQVGLFFTQFKSGVEFARQQGMLAFDPNDQLIGLCFSLSRL